jgi:hypothetical protein
MNARGKVLGETNTQTTIFAILFLLHTKAKNTLVKQKIHFYFLFLFFYKYIRNLRTVGGAAYRGAIL